MSIEFPAWVGRFDDTVDELLEHVRGNPTVDTVMERATNAAEFSKIWQAIGLIRGVVLRRPDQAIAFAIGLGAESLIVNQGIKRLFRRRRPTEGGDDRYEIRAPVTSSFPSGHASAATFAAVTLVGWDGKASIPLYAPIAAAITLSRPYVRIHHASDVVGGVAVGAALAWGFRKLLPASVNR